MRKIILFILYTFCISCQKAQVADLIDDNDYKYWYKQEGTNIEFYFFDKNGYWTIFEKQPFSSFRKYNGGDCMLHEKWKLTNDSVILYNGYEHKINHVSDTLLVIDNDTFRNAPKDAIPLRFKRKGPFEFEKNKKNNFWFKPGKTFYWDE